MDSGERLLDKVKERLTILVELDPPRTFDTTKFLKEPRHLTRQALMRLRFRIIRLPRRGLVIWR